MTTKSSEALHTTENHPLKRLEELHPAPKGEQPQAPLNKDPMHINDGSWEEFIQDSPKLLGRAFDGFEASSKGDKALMGAYFDTKDYESHSPLLRKYAEAGHIPSDKTLQERVRALTGRR